MYRKSSQGWLKHWDFIVFDIICLQIAFIVGYVLRNGISNPYAVYDYRSLAIILTLVDLLVILFFGTFRGVLKRGMYKEFAMTVKHVCLVFLSITFYLFSVHRGEIYSRAVLYIFSVVYLFLAYIMRLCWKRYLCSRTSSDRSRSIFIITTFSRAGKSIENIQQSGYGAFRVAGIAITDRDMRGEKICGINVDAYKDDMLTCLKNKWVDEVFINLPQGSRWEELLEKLTEMGLVIHINLMSAIDITGQKRFVEKLGDYTVLTTSLNYATPKQAFLKRSLDILGGLVGCLITLFLTIVIGPLIYIQSPGPIFFSQERVGKNGRRFRMYKFRSMYLDAEERKQELMAQNRVKDGMMFKLDWDPRIIGSKKMPDGTTKKGIGNIIRDLSLDEFPQFFNVLKGDMSLVGTRPPTIDEWEKYEMHHRARLAIKPGITGMWQVSGRSNITDFEEVVELDKKYIREWSMGMDIKIMLKTVAVVLDKDGAM